MAEFDRFAERYEAHMERSCALAGEAPEFYAVERMKWMQGRLKQRLPLNAVLDFGCGTGGSLRLFRTLLGAIFVVGIDPSAESLARARERCPDDQIWLMTQEQFQPAGDLPFAFANGVFHHIRQTSDRFGALDYIRHSLEPGGLFALWENNPWNPVVKYGMSLNEFDRDAHTLSSRTAINLLRESGFAVEAVDYCFFFPHFARRLRKLEPALRKCPLGAQYMVLARKI